MLLREFLRPETSKENIKNHHHKMDILAFPVAMSPLTSLNATRDNDDDNGIINLPPRYFKIILTTGLFLLTIVVSLIPLKFLALARRGPQRRRRKFKKVLSQLSCFAGGVFLGACFLDFLIPLKFLALRDAGRRGEDASSRKSSVNSAVLQVVSSWALASSICSRM